jgi:hypothetical protein
MDNMDQDFASQEVRAPEPDIRRLPEIESVKVVRVRYRTPVQYAEGASRKEADEAIEFQVTTSADFPIRALAPALFVGDTAVTESMRVGDQKYLFVSYGRHEFKDEVPISVGWFGSGTPERKLSRFTFRVEGEETR